MSTQKRIHSVMPRLVLLLVLLCSCNLTSGQQPPAPTAAAPIRVQDLDITTGQTIYVPAYSEIYYATGRTLELAVTLLIHNTDTEHPIIITAVRYYNTQGELVRDYLSQPQQLGPLASTDFFVEGSEASGGLGTNFIVEWVAEQAVYEPIIEAIMLSTSGAQGVSFTSPGRVIKQLE